jgi:hypothetical protein
MEQRRTARERTRLWRALPLVVHAILNGVLYSLGTVALARSAVVGGLVVIAMWIAWLLGMGMVGEAYAITSRTLAFPPSYTAVRFIADASISLAPLVAYAGCILVLAACRLLQDHFAAAFVVHLAMPFIGLAGFVFLAHRSGARTQR